MFSSMFSGTLILQLYTLKTIVAMVNFSRSVWRMKLLLDFSTTVSFPQGL